MSLDDLKIAKPTGDLKEHYQEHVVPALLKHFGYSSSMQVPKLEKITLNMGLGEAVNDKKILDTATEQLGLISGQKPMVTYARKSIAGFKIRDGYPIGCKVTLRGKSMWNFFNRLTHIALPRVRDFRGLSPKSFDGFGNFSFGIKEQIVFPEIDFDKVDKIYGMDVVLTTSAKKNDEGFALLKLLGLPFTSR